MQQIIKHLLHFNQPTIKELLLTFILNLSLTLYDHVKDNHLALNSDFVLIQETF